MDLIARQEVLKSKFAHIEHRLVEEEGRRWPNFDLDHELKRKKLKIKDELQRIVLS